MEMAAILVHASIDFICAPMATLAVTNLFLLLCKFFIPGVVIGMEETSVFVDENLRRVTLCASVMSGALGKEVVTSVIYERRNAHGMYNGQSGGYTSHTHIHTHSVVAQLY